MHIIISYSYRMMRCKMNFGDKIKYLRKVNNMTATELAEHLNVTQPVVSKLENNIQSISLDTLVKICDIFNITLSDFFKPDPYSNEIDLALIKSFETLDPDTCRSLLNIIASLKKMKNPKDSVKMLENFLQNMAK